MSGLFVLDASVALTWCFPEEGTFATAKLLDRVSDTRAVVPALWFSEVANVVAIASRKQSRLSPERRASFLELVGALDIDVDATSGVSVLTTVLPIADRYSLSVYDATYLELTIRLQIPLATLDKKLRVAAAAARVDLLGLD